MSVPEPGTWCKMYSNNLDDSLVARGRSKHPTRVGGVTGDVYLSD